MRLNAYKGKKGAWMAPFLFLGVDNTSKYLKKQVPNEILSSKPLALN